MHIPIHIISAAAWVLFSTAASQGQEQPEPKDLTQELDATRAKLVEECKFYRSEIHLQPFRQIKDRAELIDDPDREWPDDAVAVRGAPNGRWATLFVVPRDVLQDFVFPPFSLESSRDAGFLLMHCRHFSVVYDVMPERMREALQRDAAWIANECEAPRGLAERLAREVAGQTELALWKSGAGLLSQDVDYDEMTLEELLRITVFARSFCRSGVLRGDQPFAELAGGDVTMVISWDGQALVDSEYCNYWLFIREEPYYHIQVRYPSETKERPRPEGWQEALAHVHRSILTCGLRMLDK